ncbi:predicted membrane protein [Hahella chejuensis KCTC 2396]|uniref:Predicted membrane protein n=1 Tax=Hahella chejuensis (strain KCTC 2396) TaxID=349521 RepID=Q2SCX4_HAHCH|nr:DoxX family protein [Hahella chejuensis]ABC31500.1 predicted membrane protein [Hahella chejuensis KCTC 2396]
MIITSTAPYAALLLRLSLGVMFLAHGLLKLLVFTPAGTAGFFGSLGLPGWFAYLAIMAELGGGALLIAGYRTQWVALALTPILLGSIVFVHGANGWAFSAEGGGWEYPAFLLAASLAQALLGDGAFAIRDLVKGKSGPRAALSQS